MDPVTICNMALGWIGKGKIRTIDPDEADDAAEELCSIFYEPDVKSTLEEVPWLFATGPNPVDLGAPAETGDPKFPVFFATGSEIIKVRYVFNGSGDPLDFEPREGGIVTEDTDKALVIATKFISDPTKWTPTFCRAVAARIAADIAGPLTESSRKVSEMEARYKDELKRAGILDRAGAAAVPIVKRTSALSARR